MQRGEKYSAAVVHERALLVMGELRSGKTKNQIFNYKLAKPPIYAALFKRWCEENPELGEEARALAERNCFFNKGAPRRNQTHCKQGHPLSGDNVYFKIHGTGRVCRICHERNDKQRRRMSEDQARRVIAALHEGETIASVTSGGTPTYILHHRALLLFMRANPKFDRIARKLSSANAKKHTEEAGIRRRTAVRARAFNRMSENLDLIQNAVPRTLPRQVRDEVVASMNLAVVEGRLKPQDIDARANEYVKNQFRQFSNYGPLSLDTPVFDEGDLTLGDTVTRGLWQNEPDSPEWG